MNSKEICDYINSAAVRDYLLSINYEFSSAKAAWVVYSHDNISLDSKIESWKSILDSMPDCKVVFGNNTFESFHDALREYIYLQEKNLSCLPELSDGEYFEFSLQIMHQNDRTTSWTNESHGCFTSYNDCLSYMLKYYSAPRHLEKGTSRLIRKMTLNPKCIEDRVASGADYNLNGEITDLFFDTGEEPLLMDAFFWGDISLPTPFEVGDIIYDPFRGFVQNSLTVICKVPNSSESSPSITIVPDDYEIEGYHLFPNSQGYLMVIEPLSHYSDYDYYPLDQLEGKQRIYKNLSDYLKNKIDLSMFLNIYTETLFDERCNETRSLFERG